MYFIVEFLGELLPTHLQSTSSHMKREVLTSFVFDVDESVYKSVTNYVHSRCLAYNYKEIFNGPAYQKFNNFNLDVNSFHIFDRTNLIYLHESNAIQVFDYQLNGNNINTHIFRKLLQYIQDNHNVKAVNLIFLQE